MNRKILTPAIGLLSLLATTPVYADDDWIDWYGKINVVFDKVDEENGDDEWQVNSYASRIGVKGIIDAGNGLEAFYQLEWQVDVTGNSGDNITARNQMVGLRGSFGEVLLGRHDTPTKSMQNKIDLFPDLRGDIKHAFNAEKRAPQTVQYTTNKFAGFKLKAAFVSAEDSTKPDGSSFALAYTINDLDLGIAYDTDVENAGVETTRFMAQYKIDGWQLGFMYQNTDFNAASGDGFLISAQYRQGNNTFKVQIIETDVWQAGVSSKVKYSSLNSLGWDHKLAKNLTAYTYLTLGEEGATKDDYSIFGVGLILKF